jgi:hypothetical protein
MAQSTPKKRGRPYTADPAEVLRLAPTMHQAELARHFGITRARISQILKELGVRAKPFNDLTEIADLRPGDLNRFWGYVRMGDGCWEWTGATQGGYGAFHLRSRVIRSSRFSWMIHRGEIPAGMVVCHRCDNPPCVRPDHLFLGDHTENAIDSLSKGRGRWQKVA